MWPENWISLKLLFSPLCAGTSRDNTTKIEPRRTTETQRASEIWVSSWMLGFLLARHDLFRSVGLCRGERRWYLSALLFTALFCNATGWTCLKPDRRFYSARPAGYLKWIVSFSASVVDILVRLFFELAPSRLQARTWMIQQRIITRTFMSHFTLMCFIVYWKGMKRINIKTRAQKCANGTEVPDTGQAETTTRHILFPLNQWMQTGSILLPWSQ